MIETSEKQRKLSLVRYVKTFCCCCIFDTNPGSPTLFDQEEHFWKFSAATFAFLTVSLTNILLIAGIRLKRYVFLIPYFTVCVLFIFALLLNLFVDFLETANSKDTVETSSFVNNGFLFFLVCFEIYMLTIVWRAFVYICDFNMQRQIVKIEKKKSMAHTYSDIEYDLLRNQIIRQELKANEEL